MFLVVFIDKTLRIGQPYSIELLIYTSNGFVVNTLTFVPFLSYKGKEVVKEMLLVTVVEYTVCFAYAGKMVKRVFPLKKDPFHA